ncbi:MAG: hypothetical protein WCE63_17980 [Acidobacteriaceae bacterium]
MPTLPRMERYATHLEKIVAHRRAEATETAPKRYLVAECEALITAGSARDTTVFDLDTGREHRVQYAATVLP